MRTVDACVATASLLAIVWTLTAATDAAAMDYLAFWTDESEVVVVGQITRIVTLEVREERRTSGPGDEWGPFRLGTVAETETLQTIKGTAEQKLYAWAEGSAGGPPLAVDARPALMFLDEYNGMMKTFIQYRAEDGTARRLLSVSAGDGRGRMPISTIGKRDYVTAWHDEHLPSYVHPSHRRARLDAVIEAIERRVKRADGAKQRAPTPSR